jgi:lauroyl/myristoyl acyltransferase
MSFKFKAMKPMVFKPTGDRKADTRAVLESLNRELEEAIREYPEQYLWAHRRWK